ncbi:MAG: hypothetical protein Q9187_002347 [Circinaria calcarea]
MSGTLLTISLPSRTLLGVDLLSLTTSPTIHGISNIPPGWHFVFTGATASLSVRHGIWFHVPDTSHIQQNSLGGSLIVRKWDAGKEELVPVTDKIELETWRRRLQAEGGKWGSQYLMGYRQSASGSSTTVATTSISSPQEEKDGPSTWSTLTAHATHSLLSRLTSRTFTLTSTSCSLQDRDEIPGLSASEVASALEGEELVFLGIDLSKTWRDGAIGRERTEGARDRGWALAEAVRKSREECSKFSKGGEVEGEGEGQWGDEVLGEMEVCFLMVLTLGNYSCLEEWKRVLELIFTSRQIVREQEEFFCEALRILGRQLRRCEDVEGGLFDFSDEGGGGAFLKKLLKGFRRALAEMFADDGTEGEGVKAEMEEVEEWAKEEYGWDLSDDMLRRGMLVLEDGEMVEMEMDGAEEEEERGEYAPVIVELGQDS